MEGIKAVFFDWDGTLVDTVAGVLAAHNHVRAHFGMGLWELDWFKKNMSRPARTLYPEIYGDKADMAIDMLYSYIDETHLDGLQALPGAETLLRMLYEMNMPMAVISNKKHKYLQREVSHIGWQNYFMMSVGSGVTAQDKPAADPLLKVLSDHELKPQDVLYVGDTETDLRAARACDCEAVLLLNGDNKDSLAEEYKPYLIVEDCMALHDYFCKNTGNLVKIKTC